MISKSLTDTQKMAKDFLQNLSPSSTQATIVELIGDLGSGKTTFTKAFASELGVVETVISPTFVIQKRYDIPNHPQFKTLIHIDAYRLENPSEILKLNWQQDLENPKNVILVEWSGNIQEHIPQSTQIHFAFVDEATREIIW